MHDDDQRGAAAAAREEAARQTVWLAAMLLAIPVLAWVERKVTSPDALRQLRMQLAREAERFCMDAARGWANLADKAHQAYERECA